MEEWRDVPGYEGRYQVSSIGGVRTLRYKRGDTVRALKPSPDSHGYQTVVLYGNGPRRHVGVHQLVTAAFLGGKPAGLWINHIDGVRTNNAAANLEYTTPGENQKHAVRLGLKDRGAGERNPFAKLTEAAVREAKSLRAAGARYREIAPRFGVSSSTIERAVRGVRWQVCQEGG